MSCPFVAGSKKKRTSKQGASTVDKRQKSLINHEKPAEEKSMAHLLVVGESPADNSKPASKPAPSHSVFSVLTSNAAKAFQTHHFFCGIPFGKQWQTGEFVRPGCKCSYGNLAFPLSSLTVMCRYVGSRTGSSCTCNFAQVDRLSESESSSALDGGWRCYATTHSTRGRAEAMDRHSITCRTG